MIVNSLRIPDIESRRRVHGMAITVPQIEVLRTWLQFNRDHIYEPTQRELVKLSGIHKSQVTMWMQLWEDNEYIERGRGLRNHHLNPIVAELIQDYDELNEQWEAYIAKRNRVLNKYGGFTYSGKTLILIYGGKIPAMKNETRVNLKEYLVETPTGVETKMGVAGVGKPAHIRRWLKMGESAALSQMESQGFGRIPMPYRVATWTILGFYKARSNRDPLFIPKNDADNAFTTVQETWKETIMDDDRQVVDYHVSTRHFDNEQTMHTVSFLWTLPLSKHDYHEAIDIFRTQLPTMSGKPTWELMRDMKGLI